MDTLNKENYRKTVFVAYCVLTFGLNILAQAKQPVESLSDSYRLPEKLTADAAEKTISELNEAIASGTDPILKSRITYRIGMLYFKSGDWPRALDRFEEVAQSADCPDLIRLCGLNMAGQIYRMQAKDDRALKAFGELIDLSQKLIAEDPNQENPVSVIKLAVTAGFSRAEIYQYNLDYDSAMAEYQKILRCLNPGKTSLAEMYAPQSLDRLSQLYLIERKNEEYAQTAGELVEKYPAYYRTGIIQLETEAVRLLQKKDPNAEFSKGGFDAPARLIGLIKNTGDKTLTDPLAALLKDLSGRYRQSYSGILLEYHNAWLLDTLADSKQAAGVFDDVCKQAASANPTMPPTAPIIRTLADYAKLQQAIILGEETQYKEALQAVNSIKHDPNNVHLFDLAETIEKSLETLKREVPKDDNNK